MGSVLFRCLRPLGAALLLCPIWLFCMSGAALAAASAQTEWRSLEPGIELAIFTPDTQSLATVNIVVARLEPDAVDFVLLSASETGAAASLTEWADKQGLVAAINASMYLPDASTSTGYMRNGGHFNNPRIAGKFGAFFVAGSRRPVGDNPALPRAAILDRDADPWEERLPLYDVVVQNYRLISADGRMLWTPDGPSYAVAAVGQDRAGRILFIHCREPMTGSDFGNLLLTLPLDLRTVMYVEGGSQAGLLVRAGGPGGVNEVWMGRHMADFLTSGNKSAPLPNVIGVKRRPAAPQTTAQGKAP